MFFSHLTPFQSFFPASDGDKLHFLAFLHFHFSLMPCFPCISEEFIRQHSRMSEYAAALSPLLSRLTLGLIISTLKKNLSQIWKVFSFRRRRMFDLMLPARPCLESRGSENYKNLRQDNRAGRNLTANLLQFFSSFEIFELLKGNSWKF